MGEIGENKITINVGYPTVKPVPSPLSGLRQESPGGGWVAVDVVDDAKKAADTKIFVKGEEVVKTEIDKKT